MSEPCRYQYNACLNHCRAATPRPAGDNVPQAAPQQDQVDVAHCTDQCNTQAKDCR